MKNKKSVIITIVVIIAVVIIGLITYRVLTNENKLTASERRWINNNIDTVQNINVVNDVNLFGNTGTGVFYEFLNDFEQEYKLELNPVTFNYGEQTSALTLGIVKSLKENDFVFYTDHYVLVGLEDEVVSGYQDLEGLDIGVVKDDASYISSYFADIGNITLSQYEDKAKLLEAFSDHEDIHYMIVPLSIYLDEILKNDYVINYHLSDIELYYVIRGNDDTLTSILEKFYYNWYQDNLDSYLKREEFNLFTTALGISETEVDAMRSITYNYGFINNSPYEVIMSGNYGGIIAMYLYDFSEFSDVEFNYTKYRNLNRFKKAVSNNDIDLYFNYYNLSDNYYDIDSNLAIRYSVIASNENNLVVNSIQSLVGKTVYVDENSFLHDYLSSIKGIQIETYEDEKDLKKLNRKDVIIVIDKNIFDLYSGSNLSNYTERYTSSLNDTYQFKSRTDSAFYKLFSKYAMVVDHNKVIYDGMYSHSMTVRTGSILGTIAKYILITLVIFAVIFIIFYKNSKRIKIAKRIKKDNKMKFIDQLTSLKNRNYLNEYIHNWNNNTVYPQTMIVIDLNNIQFINDTLGYEEGDKQIKAAANILIKTQLNNSDIMRTDGNEFLIYLVGFTQKQVTNYIHKLNKEFKKLPYEYGAEFGYSMINDNVKTIEDAILEATDEMKSQKKKSEDKNA
ncbi:diguanylate cyclase with GAF sensor [Mycoplasma sp. CAG:776]|nr:diguanylate cyclase with GAF sensor [Mycoplasma sp. CAG:776]